MDGTVRLSRPTTLWFWGLIGVGLAVLVAARWFSAEGPAAQVCFSASYLVSYCFFPSISLGAFFFVAMQHLVRAGWSVAVRRLGEMIAANLIWWGILFLPILVSVLLGTSRLYIWLNADAVAGNALLQAKAPYLNGPFFAVRAVFYFATWALLAWFFLKQSVRQDESADSALTRRMERAAPVALILFALTVTFASFDWLMSLEPEWFSTIYGPYFFAGAIVGGVAAMILMAMAVQVGGLAHGVITTEHFHDLGKFLLGFVIFWDYMAFSQYMLIWYANIPEETVWYLARQSGDWAWLSTALLFGNLLIPFLGLLPREVKRRKICLGFWAVWMLVFHWIDLYWLVMPTFFPQRVVFQAVDLACLVGLGCFFLAGIRP